MREQGKGGAALGHVRSSRRPSQRPRNSRSSAATISSRQSVRLSLAVRRSVAATGTMRGTTKAWSTPSTLTIGINRPTAPRGQRSDRNPYRQDRIAGRPRREKPGAHAGSGSRTPHTDARSRSAVVGRLVVLSDHFGERAVFRLVSIQCLDVLTDLLLEPLSLASRDFSPQRLFGDLRRVDPEALGLHVEVGVDRQADRLLDRFQVVSGGTHTVSTCNLHVYITYVHHSLSRSRQAGAPVGRPWVRAATASTYTVPCPRCSP